MNGLDGGCKYREGRVGVGGERALLLVEHNSKTERE